MQGPQSGSQAEALYENTCMNKILHKTSEKVQIAFLPDIVVDRRFFINPALPVSQWRFVHT